MSFRRNVVLTVALASIFWGFSRGASATEPHGKPTPPIAKFAKGLFSGMLEPESTPASEVKFEKPEVTNDTGVPANNSPQERPEDANSASAANTNRLRDVSPSVQISLQETSSLQATFEKLKASRSSESNLEIKREQGVTDFPPTATASQMASHPAVIGSSETASEVPLSELPGSELQLYTTPPYQTKITHRGITDHATTRTESLRITLRRLRQEREEFNVPQTNRTENRFRDQKVPAQVAEVVVVPPSDVPIANVIAGDLEASRLAPVVRSSDLASRPSKQSNPLRERDPAYRSLRVSDWQEPPTRVTAMATATSPATIQNRYVDASEQVDKTDISSPVVMETPFQFQTSISGPDIAEFSSLPIGETRSALPLSTENTIHNPYTSAVETDSPRPDAEPSKIAEPAHETYFANPRDAAISTENSPVHDSEGMFAQVNNHNNTPAAEFAFDTRLPGDEEGEGDMVFNTWVTPADSIADEEPSLQTALSDTSGPTFAAQPTSTENGNSDLSITESNSSEPSTTSYRTMTIPTRSRSLIRPSRVVEVEAPPANPETSEIPTSNLDSEKQEVASDQFSGSTTAEQESPQTLPRRGPVIKPSPRPIALPRR